MTVYKSLSLNIIDSPIGPIALAGPSPEAAFIRLQVESVEEAAKAIALEYNAPIIYDPDSFPQLQGELSAYFDGTQRRFQAPYRFLGGTPFQRRVWSCLATIPFGRTWSYGKIADTIGRPKAVRAVGQAVGSNPLAILLPCHRVVRSDGGLGGFFYGAGLKSRLLEMEANATGNSNRR
ncbi:methylated-DNA--[protein]-cysteine S-methyltransferase [candidate division KSB1 bacterium]